MDKILGVLLGVLLGLATASVWVVAKLLILCD